MSKKMSKKDEDKLLEALAKKKEMKVWADVDQYLLDNAVVEYRRKGWTKMIKLIHKEAAERNYTIPMTQEAIVKWEKGLTTKERTVLRIGLAGFDNMRKRPVYKCKVCNDTGFVREVSGVFMLDSKGAKKSYLAGRAGSPDGLIGYSAPDKCQQCTQ